MKKCSSKVNSEVVKKPVSEKIIPDTSLASLLISGSFFNVDESQANILKVANFKRKVEGYKARNKTFSPQYPGLIRASSAEFGMLSIDNGFIQNTQPQRPMSAPVGSSASDSPVNIVAGGVLVSREVETPVNFDPEQTSPLFKIG